jgi:hypothetical protein
MDAYRSHDLSIAMKTSSGDVINLDFANKQSMSMNHKETSKGTQDSLSFSSMQSFQFSIDSNGIDAQDKKEIQAFMKIAQPFIDDFLKELDQDSPKTPVNKLANTIADIFRPMQEKDKNTKDFVKTNLINQFDNSMKKMENIDKIFNDAKDLLERTLNNFDKINKELYA